MNVNKQRRQRVRQSRRLVIEIDKSVSQRVSQDKTVKGVNLKLSYLTAVLFFKQITSRNRQDGGTPYHITGRTLIIMISLRI